MIIFSVVEDLTKSFMSRFRRGAARCSIGAHSGPVGACTSVLICASCPPAMITFGSSHTLG